MSNREARLFVERSPTSMDWLEKVFNLIKNSVRRGFFVSGELEEVRMKCENKIEILADRHALADHERGKVYFDDDAHGSSKDSDEWIDQKLI